MEYVFGTEGGTETLRTKGGEHTSLGGFVTVIRERPEETVTDSFHVVGRVKSSEDGEGNCYDWYEIERHYRYSDKSGAVMRSMELEATELEIGLMEQEQAITDHDIAIMELQEAVGV